MSLVKDVINNFDSSDELAKVQKEAIEALAALGNSKADVYKMEIQESLASAGNGTNLTIPVSAVLSSLSDVRAFSSSESDNIGNVVKNALSSFIKGSSKSIIGGIGSLISDTMSIFLGKSSASTGTTEEYYIAIEGLSIIRIDMKAWYLNVSSSSIKSKMERIAAVVAVKSVVDLAKIDFSTFLNLYQQQLLETGMNKQQLSEALNSAKEIYKDFKNINGDSNFKREKIITPPAHQTLVRKTIAKS